MAYDSRRRRLFFLSPVRAAFALLAAFFAPLLAGLVFITDLLGQHQNYKTPSRIARTVLATPVRVSRVYMVINNNLRLKT
jgi:hypothetical protein